VVDCPPDFSVITGITESIGSIDDFIIPIESRFSIQGAMTLIGAIRNIQATSRIILVLNKQNNSSVSQSDRTEAAKIAGVELYRRAIPNGVNVVHRAEQNGVAVWKGGASQVGKSLREFADWSLAGCSASGVYSPSQVVERQQFVESKVIDRRAIYGQW
jgi:hypothetical protein